MKKWLVHSSRRALAVAALTLSSPMWVQAQELEGEGTESSGSPYYGYIGTGVVLAMIIFAVCKSARR